MEKGFSGSEDLAKSLEPNYDSYKDHEKKVMKKMEEVVEKPKKPKFQLPKRQPKPQDPHAPRRRKRFEVFAAIYLGLVLLLCVVLAANTDTQLFLVVLSLLPSLLTIVVAMIVYEAHRDNKSILWVIPIILIYAFYWYGSSGGGIVAGMNVDALTAINIFVSFTYLIVNYFLLQKDFPKEKVVTKVIKAPESDDLPKYIASIEDKSKALNFVIGRVYNAYHGGTKELRLKINMKQEWYDQFSLVPAEPEKIDFPALRDLITTIEKRLKHLEKTESEVFGSDHKGFKNLVRNADGLDRVIDVLDKNDKDPVKAYYEGALDFCGRVQEFIKNRKVPEVKNEYVERPGENEKKAPRSSNWYSNLLKD